MFSYLLKIRKWHRETDHVELDDVKFMSMWTSLVDSVSYKDKN